MDTMLQVPPRQRLVAERLRRHWTQLEVADQLGTTPGNVSRWERGITSPGRYFRGKLCELFGSSARELGLTWDGADDTLIPYTHASALAASFQRNVSQENGEQGQLTQDVEEWLRTGLSRIPIPANAGAVVLVVLNSNVESRLSSLQKGRSDRRVTRGEDCGDEYPPIQGTLRQRQGA